jgi:hypothetical protein
MPHKFLRQLYSNAQYTNMRTSWEEKRKGQESEREWQLELRRVWVDPHQYRDPNVRLKLLVRLILFNICIDVCVYMRQNVAGRGGRGGEEGSCLHKLRAMAMWRKPFKKTDFVQKTSSLLHGSCNH